MTAWLDDGDVRLYHGDCLEVLRGLPDRSVHMCATSPPFYGLRDYGADGQIGLEETPDQWVERLVDVFREVRRVLRDDGTLWVEIGDSYMANQSGTNLGPIAPSAWTGRSNVPRTKHPTKQKDLLGQPWLLAFALRADGWYLRSEIIWARPNPMPESVTDRPTKSHSTVFLLSKSRSYFYDADAIREAFSPNTHSAGRNSNPGADDSSKDVRSRYNDDFAKSTPLRHVDIARLHPQTETLDGSDGEAPRGPDGRRVTAVKGQKNSEQHRDGERWPNPSGANARSVWTIPTEPTPFAHFATWPRKLVARMIQAGTSERGCCPECGAPWVRDIERDAPPENATPGHTPSFNTRRYASATPGHITGSRTLGWSPSCTCVQLDPDDGLYPRTAGCPPPVPCTVLDPFAGSGTTLLVARHHGRHSIGIELNEQYLKIAAGRLAQLSLLTGADA